MKNYIFRNVIVAFALMIFASSCKKDVPAGGTAVEVMAGDWYVKVNNTGVYYAIYTFNTSDNSSTQMWLQTGATLKSGSTVIGVKGKVSVDLSAKTFSASNATNILSTSATIPTFSVANGKVITNGTVGPASNAPADLISFDLIVGGVTYKVEGYHKTGYLEDIP